MKSETIVFFGSSKVSLEALEALARSFKIEAVITKPDSRLHGRLHSPAVKTWAKAHKLPVKQPASAAELEKLMQNTQRFTSRIGVVIDYGLIIPTSVIEAFELGLVNSHFSLLPQWRGADPIRAAILSGQTTTGVSLMLITPEVDAGPLLTQAKLPIPPDATASSLTRQLSALNQRLLPRSLRQYIRGEISPLPQNPDQVPTYTRKLSKTDGVIDWQKPVVHLEREIRAYQGWPGSQAKLGGKPVIITQAHVVEQFGSPGQVFRSGRQLGVYGGQGALIIDRLKPAGGREMSGSAFLNGLKLPK